MRVRYLLVVVGMMSHNESVILSLLCYIFFGSPITIAEEQMCGVSCLGRTFGICPTQYCEPLKENLPQRCCRAQTACGISILCIQLRFDCCMDELLGTT